MPRNKGIGMNKPKKKKVEAGPSVSEEPVADDDFETFEAAPDPAFFEPDPEPTPAIPVMPVRSLTRVEELEAERNQAAKKAITVIKRWLKTVDTYFNEDPGFLWRECSDVKRNLTRLQHIDEERDKAEDFADYKEKEVIMYKNWAVLRRMANKFPNKSSHARQRDVARARLNALRWSWQTGEYHAADRRPQRGANLADQIGIIMLQVGLAEARQWVHASALREDLYSDERPPTRSEVLARAAANTKEHYRRLVHKRLQQEQVDPSLRWSRPDMLCWTDSELVDMRACIIDALREVGECLCRGPGAGTCEMCRNRTAGESSGQPSAS